MSNEDEVKEQLIRDIMGYEDYQDHRGAPSWAFELADRLYWAKWRKAAP